MLNKRRGAVRSSLPCILFFPLFFAVNLVDEEKAAEVDETWDYNYEEAASVHNPAQCVHCNPPRFPLEQHYHRYVRRKAGLGKAIIFILTY